MAKKENKKALTGTRVRNQAAAVAGLEKNGATLRIELEAARETIAKQAKQIVELQAKLTPAAA